jgi:beta-galactosidase
MKFCRSVLFSALALALGACSMTPSLIKPPASEHASDAVRNEFFPKADMMRIGVYYYPTAWPESEWARDFANIKKLNLE